MADQGIERRLALNTYTLNWNRSESPAVFSAESTKEAESAEHWWSSLKDKTVMRTIETKRFRVEFIAHQPQDLDLSWLRTEAYIDDDNELVIVNSCQYTQGDVDKYGSAKVVEWINQDHDYMRSIVSAYIGMSDTPRVFDAEVRVVHKKSGTVLGEDTLCGCIYESYEEFCQGGGYASDMVYQAVRDARYTIHDLCL